MRYKYFCPQCGDGVLAERWDAGYRYCKKKECFLILGKRYPHIDIAGVEINPLELDDVSNHYDNDHYGD